MAETTISISPLIIVLFISIVILIVVIFMQWETVDGMGTGMETGIKASKIAAAGTLPTRPTLTPPDSPTPLDQRIMTFAVFNDSTYYNTQAVNRAMAAIQNQTTFDYGPSWGWQAEFIDGPGCLVANTVPVNVIPIFIVDSGTYVKQAIAYHSIQAGIKTNVPLSVKDSGVNSLYKVFCGNPFIVVYAKNANSVGSLTYPLSHEVLETLADPLASLVGAQTSTSGNTTAYYWYEICDPVEFGNANQSSYVKTVEGTSQRVSNFVTPDWFNSNSFYRSGGSKPSYDFLNVFTKPFQNYGNPGNKLMSVHASAPNAPLLKDKIEDKRFFSLANGKKWAAELAKMNEVENVLPIAPV